MVKNHKVNPEVKLNPNVKKELDDFFMFIFQDIAKKSESKSKTHKRGKNKNSKTK
jgi:hypothetical protein